MTYFQGSYYELVFPISDAEGSPISSLSAAKLTFKRAGEVVSELTIGDGLSLANSEITAVINTLDLVGTLNYELWIKTDDEKPHLMRKENITFSSTFARI